MGETVIPEERLRVFISSAQSNENGFAWGDVRRRIKECLSVCPYLNPFIIEDNPSTTPSLQFFQSQLRKADLTVLLVKGEVRKGTAVEYAQATKWKKPLLIYFLKDDQPDLDVIKLKRELQTTDYCTYREVDNFDNIAPMVRNDVIEDVIRWFQDKPYILEAYNHKEDSGTALILEEQVSSKSGVPEITAISLFSSSYEYLLDLLGTRYLKRNQNSAISELGDLGNELLEWLVNGKPLQCDDKILNLLEKSTSLYASTDWLEKRWDAIRCCVNGNLDKALEYEREALRLSKNDKMPSWITTDILIDCRNMEIDCAKAKGKRLIEGPAQKELNELDSIVYLPVLDRYKSNIYSTIAKEKFKISTASRYTTIYGNSINEVLSDTCNYLFSAALYGSYTHLLIARKILIYVLCEYFDILNDVALIQKCVSLYILQGDVKELELFVQKNWDTVYSLVTTEADALWKLAKRTPIVNQSAMQQAVLKILGLYFSDDTFQEAEEFILSRADQIYWGNSQEYLGCIKKNLIRLNQDKVVTILINIISQKRYIRGKDITNIIWTLDLNKISKGNILALRDALDQSLATIVENGGSPQIIAFLMRFDPAVFGCLESKENNGLTGIEEKLYKINMGGDAWEAILQDEITQAQNHFSAYNSDGVYAAFASDPYAMIGYISRKASDTNAQAICNILSEKFVPLAVEVLNSHVAVPTKESCANALCDVVALFIQHNISFPATLIDSLRNIDTTQGYDFVQYKSRAMLEIRIFMAKLMVGLLGKESLLTWCVEYNKRSLNERVGLAECIEKYLYYHKGETADALILSIVFQCADDESDEIRRIAYQTLSYLLDSNAKSLVENRIYQAMTDPSSSVRNKILSLCEKGLFEYDMARSIVEALTTDSNYAIRIRALAVKNDMGHPES